MSDNRSMTDNRPRRRGRRCHTGWRSRCLVIGALSWAGSSVAGRAASGNIPPFSLSFIRWSCVALLFLLVSWTPDLGAAPSDPRDIWPLLAAFGFFGVVGFTVPYYVGLQFTVAVNASLMNASGTLWIVRTAFLMTGALISRKQALGVLAGFQRHGDDRVTRRYFGAV